MPDCLFCKIVRGEITADRVYEDDSTVAFLDIRPSSVGHTLVVPKVHATNIFDIAPESWGAVMETARTVAIALERAVGADGVNLMMNNREHAGQVIDHPHVHLIPRFQGDGLQHWPHKSYKEGEAEAVREKIRAALT